MKPSPSQSANRRGGDTSLCLLDSWAGARRADRNRLLWAMIPATVLHMVLFALRLPVGEAAAVPAKPERPVVLIRQYRIKPPEPPPIREVIPPSPQPLHRTIPMPAIEESVIEPRIEPLPVPQIEIPADAEVVYIPAPPPPTVDAEPDGPILVTGEVVGPVKLFAPEPVYPRTARLAHVGGTVIVQATIDQRGEIVDLKVLRSRPLGLTDATLQAMRRWRYEPATLHGKPVAVLVTLTATYDVQ